MGHPEEDCREDFWISACEGDDDCLSSTAMEWKLPQMSSNSPRERIHGRLLGMREETATWHQALDSFSGGQTLEN